MGFNIDSPAQTARVYVRTFWAASILYMVSQAKVPSVKIAENS